VTVIAGSWSELPSSHKSRSIILSGMLPRAYGTGRPRQARRRTDMENWDGRTHHGGLFWVRRRSTYAPLSDYSIDIRNIDAQSIGYFRSTHATTEWASAIHFFDDICWNVVRSFPEGRRPTGVSVHHRYPLYTGSQPFTGCRRTSLAMTASNGWVASCVEPTRVY